MRRIVWRCVAALALVSAASAEAETIRVINPQSFYPEGPHWADGVLYYAEMTQDRVMAWDGSANRQFWHGAGCGPTAIVKTERGTFYVFCHGGHRAHEVSAIGRTLRTIEKDEAGEPIGNPNEAILDFDGGVYFTSSGPFGPGAPALGRVFYIARDGTVRKVADRIHYANGLALSADRRSLVVGAHLERKLWRFPVEAPGRLGERELFLDLDAALGPTPAKPAWYVGPDGLLFDPPGNLYVCEYGAGRILIFGKDRTLLKVIALPQSPFVNAASFGSAPDVLYVGAADTNAVGLLPGKVYEIIRPLE
jgi:gluconolactonase